MKKVLALLCALVLSGCTNAYTKFYRPNPNADYGARVGSAPAAPILDHTSLTGDDLLRAYVEQGYAIIGNSSFNGGGSASDSDALAQGKKVGADLVVISNPRYTGTRSSVIPIVTPTSSTAYTNGQATAYGSGGSVTAYGSSTTTTYGSRTSFVPVSTDRFDFLAIYFMKVRSHLGAIVQNLSDVQTQEMQSNHGVEIVGLVKGSSAFAADMLVGDIILSVDGEVVDDSTSFLRILKSHSGRSSDIKIYRGGRVINKRATIY